MLKDKFIRTKQVPIQVTPNNPQLTSSSSESSLESSSELSTFLAGAAGTALTFGTLKQYQKIGKVSISTNKQSQIMGWF